MAVREVVVDPDMVVTVEVVTEDDVVITVLITPSILSKITAQPHMKTKQQTKKKTPLKKKKYPTAATNLL
jgi:hypothetical protein